MCPTPNQPAFHLIPEGIKDIQTTRCSLYGQLYTCISYSACMHAVMSSITQSPNQSLSKSPESLLCAGSSQTQQLLMVYNTIHLRMH